MTHANLGMTHRQRTVISPEGGDIALPGAAALAAPPNIVPTVTTTRPLQANTDAAPDATVLETTTWWNERDDIKIAGERWLQPLKIGHTTSTSAMHLTTFVQPRLLVAAVLHHSKFLSTVEEGILFPTSATVGGAVGDETSSVAVGCVSGLPSGVTPDGTPWMSVGVGVGFTAAVGTTDGEGHHKRSSSTVRTGESS